MTGHERTPFGGGTIDFYTFEVRNGVSGYECRYTVIQTDEGEAGQAHTGVPVLSAGGKQLLSAMCRELIDSGKDILKVVETVRK